MNIKTEFFSPIDLENIGKVKLMNRTDTKYWFHRKQLNQLLYAVRGNYFALSMQGEFALPYSTKYYDTSENSMFIAHQNGKLNRYKIRRRRYITNGVSFLEIKFKNNKGRTLKKRIPSSFEENDFNETEKTFIKEITPYEIQDLELSLINSFRRITLVNKNFKERCTIDFDLNFKNEFRQIALSNLVIVEVKSDGRSPASELTRSLCDLRIKKSGFSKYCMGRAIIEPELKRNNFKDKIRQIGKTIETKNNLYNIN